MKNNFGLSKLNELNLHAWSWSLNFFIHFPTLVSNLCLEEVLIESTVRNACRNWVWICTVWIHFFTTFSSVLNPKWCETRFLYISLIYYSVMNLSPEILLVNASSFNSWYANGFLWSNPSCKYVETCVFFVIKCKYQVRISLLACKWRSNSRSWESISETSFM